MAKIETIIKDIDQLDYSELEALLQVVLYKINLKKRVENILDEVTGIGKGIWDIDPQSYITNLREDR
ncbi:MAG: hypothetical protein H6562_19495 [Lewinellaceae bacterium]|nr:hypothetical protein [Lewinella sp.]MCB9281082.1 hypothetical protein [Lewinellaceae bacterium]